eukprot:m.104846 g.104846  ORF g.104846 m.104846 type:complete len:149 (+) comp20971_c4_seq1:287-733(+)
MLRRALTSSLYCSTRTASSQAGSSGEGMKLLTHNMMQSHVKGVKNGYPLNVTATTVEEVEVEFNPTFIARMLPRIEFKALRHTAGQLGLEDSLPAVVPPKPEEDEEFLRAMHHVLLEVVVIEGELICPESGVKFPIKNGIPNMLLQEE